MVTILLPALLRPHAGGAASVEVAAGTVGEAFEALFAAHPGLRPRLATGACPGQTGPPCPWHPATPSAC
jgi:molybdopterin converting factor small subunit